jgi:hypothetical protein
MKKLLFTIMVILIAGCAAYVTPSGTYIEPLYPAIVIGPPVVVAPPPAVVVRPLPPVVVVPDRHVYYYENFYYYNWNNSWYWSREQRGPWHALPRDRWPSKTKKLDRGYEREHERGGPYRY